AGGIEACAELLTSLPASLGMAFVIIQHLDPLRESQLAEIFSRSTSMPVHLADHLMVVKPNNVYVIPPNRSIGIVNGVLRLLPRIEPKPKHMVVDFFFRCLADDQKENSIGIILSGGDGDGALGLQEIRSCGGITFVQDPATARVPSMPLNAAASGSVDFVLPIPEIAKELIRAAKNPASKVIIGNEPLPGGDEETLTKLFQLMSSKLHVDFSQYKRPTILRRIKRRMVISKTPDLKSYLKVLQSRASEQQKLYDDLLINVTSFFRDTEVFATIGKKVLPRLLKDLRAGRPLRLWVPGCSCGEEAYSLAIIIMEAFQMLGVHHPIQIFATDISYPALQKARQGFYPESIKTDVSADRLRRFFVKVDGGYRVAQTIRDVCVFASHDVTQAPPFSKIDLISCRNLLIYLGPSLQKRVMGVFAYALNFKGYLVLGSSEATSLAPDDFVVVDKKSKIYQRKPNPTRENLLGLLPLNHLPIATAALPVLASNPVRNLNALEKEMQRLLLLRYKPAAVVVGEDLQIVQFYGDTSAYLEHGTGTANLNILKMARGNLHFELRKLLKPAKGKIAPSTQRHM
ncbi:MAG: hypothetical protein EOP11_19500, partial [Proteobacteria bacterium]